MTHQATNRSQADGTTEVQQEEHVQEAVPKRGRCEETGISTQLR